MACKQELWDEAKKNHKGMEELLDENYFVRVHQSFLINMKYIKSIKRNEVLLSNGMVLCQDLAQVKMRYSSN